MSVTVEVRLDAKSMADFMVYHIFTGKAGILTPFSQGRQGS